MSIQSDIQNCDTLWGEEHEAQVINSLQANSIPEDKIFDQEILSSLFTLEHLEPTLINTVVAEKLQRHLPPVYAEAESGSSAVTNLQDTLASRHFEEAVKIFSVVFETGDLGSVLKQFNIGESAVNAANKADMETFIKALEEEEKGKSNESD